MCVPHQTRVSWMAYACRVSCRPASKESGGIENGGFRTTLFAKDRADLGDLVGPARTQPQQDPDAEQQPDEGHVRRPLENAWWGRVDRSVERGAEDNRADDRDAHVDQGVPVPGGAGLPEVHDAANADHDVYDDDQQRAGGSPEVVIGQRLAEGAVGQRVTD